MSEAWERLDERTGRVVGVDENGDRYDRMASKHESYYMPRWGRDDTPSVADEEEKRRRES